jgi:hypothetical protein
MPWQLSNGHNLAKRAVESGTPMLPPHFAFDPERRNNDGWAGVLIPRPIVTARASSTVGIEVLTDRSVLTLYENIRQQVAADIHLGDRYRLLGETAKQQELRLRQEIDRRSLRVPAIHWGWLLSSHGSLFLCLYFQQVIVLLRTRVSGVSIARQDELISGGDFSETGTQLCVGQSHLVAHFLPLETGKWWLCKIAPGLPKPFLQGLYILI